jgi:hypothetical protein
MEVIDIDAPELRACAKRLQPLMQRARGDEARAPLDYLLGALHALLQAKRHRFKDRQHALDDERGRSHEGVEYWEYGPMVRVRLIADGKLRIDGGWVAGFYFNSALARLASVFDRAVRWRAIQLGLDKDPRPPRSGPPPRVWQLLREMGLQEFTKGKLAQVYEEANPLKHKAAGLARRRKVTMADATRAFGEMLDLLEHPKMHQGSRAQ